MDPEQVGKGLSTLGKGLAPAMFAKARELGVQVADELCDPEADLPPRHIVGALRDIARHFFPLLAQEVKDPR